MITVSKTDFNMSIPLFIYTQCTTPRSRDKFRISKRYLQ